MKAARSVWIGIALLGAVGTSAPGAPSRLYGPGSSAVSIGLGSADPEEARAAAELARVLRLLSGASWPVAAPTSGRSPTVWVGCSGDRPGGGTLVLAADPLNPAGAEVGPDAFRIEVHDGRAWIEGASPAACPFAVAWFLQAEAGVRWYAPGPDGEVVPHRDELVLEDVDRLVQPRYFSRELTGFEDAAGRQWAEHNGLRRRLNYSHALARSFPADLIAPHPDWFPSVGGNRYRPSSASDTNWQPNLANPEVALRAAEAAEAFFSVHPGEISYSLGINDSMRFDQGADTRRMLDPLGYFSGRPDYSPLVFAFMNRAAAATARAYPDRYLGCLAYFWCENTPPFAVDPHVVPYVASDRSQYYDDGFRRDDLALMGRWGKSGVRAFGLWDYAYGDGFVVPREPLRYLAAAIREGWRNGAQGYVAELGHPGGFDVFKAWAIARLLWDPSRSLEALADDFFPGFYGRAAPAVRQFLEGCQRQWETQGGRGYWLKYYQQADQALLFPSAVCVRLRAQLGLAEAAAARDPVVGARVAELSRAFAETEDFVAYDGARRAVAALVAGNRSAPPDEAVAAGALLRLARARVRIAASGAHPPDRLLRDDPGCSLLLRVATADAAAAGRVLRQAGGEAADRRPWLAMAAALAAGIDRLPNQTRNSAFTDSQEPVDWPRFLYPGIGRLPADWILRSMPTARARVLLVPAGALSESSEQDLRVEAAWDAQLYQWMPAAPGATYLATGALRGAVSPGCDATLVLTFLARGGQVLGVSNVGLGPGIQESWVRVALADKAPVGAAWVGVGIAAARQQADDWLEARAIELRCAHVGPGA